MILMTYQQVAYASAFAKSEGDRRRAWALCTMYSRWPGTQESVAERMVLLSSALRKALQDERECSRLEYRD